MNMRHNISTVQVTVHWKRMPREVVKSDSESGSEWF